MLILHTTESTKNEQFQGFFIDNYLLLFCELFSPLEYITYGHY